MQAENGRRWVTLAHRNVMATGGYLLSLLFDFEPLYAAAFGYSFRPFPLCSGAIFQKGAVMSEKTDWEAIRAEYISDSKCTYRSLAEKYGVSANAIAVRSRGENWRQQRRDRSESISRILIEKRTQEDVERFLQVSHTAQALVDRIEEAVSDEKQFYRYIVDSSEPSFDELEGACLPKKSEAIFSKMDTKSLRDMTAALRDALEILRRANRIPTVEQQLQHDAFMARLAFDRERYAAGDGDDRVIQLRFEDGEDFSG